jgi:hypothetical protein
MKLRGGICGIIKEDHTTYFSKSGYENLKRLYGSSNIAEVYVERDPSFTVIIVAVVA